MALEKIKSDSYIEDFHQLIEISQMQERHTILVVDDESDNLALLKRTLRKDYEILSASDGDEALKIVQQRGNEISLIISDQRMPVMTGTELFTEIIEHYPHIIKMLLTGYSDLDTLVSAVNECNLFQYILKPFDPDELKLIVQNGIKTFELTNNKNNLLVNLKELFYTTIKSISSALDAKDPYTHGHSLRVTTYSLILAKAVGMDETTLEEIETASLLHDIGKIGIPESILLKPGKLSNEEFDIMKSHPEKGKKMLSSITKLKAVCDWLCSHHEKWDGTGYPDKLAGHDIPLSARIISIADTYDAMTSDRPYRKALSHEIAIDEIRKFSGSQFDPEFAQKFIELEDFIKEVKDNAEHYYQEYSQLYSYFKDNQ